MSRAGQRPKVLRKISAPLRGFFNDHFAMVKADLNASLAQLRTEIRASHEEIALTAERLEETAGFLGLRMSRLEESIGTTAFDAVPLWWAIVAHTVAQAAPTTPVRLHGNDDRLGNALVALGHRVQGGSPPEVASSIVVLTDVLTLTDALACVSSVGATLTLLRCEVGLSPASEVATRFGVDPADVVHLQDDVVAVVIRRR